MHAHQRRGDILRAAFGEQAFGQRPIFIVDFHRHFHQRGEQAFMVVAADIVRPRHRQPFGVDLGTAQHGIDAAAGRIGHDQHGGTLFAGTPGAARTVLQDLRIARQFDMDDQRQIGQIDPARSDIGGDADARAAIPEGL